MIPKQQVVAGHARLSMMRIPSDARSRTVRRQDWPLREGCASGFSELGKEHETTSDRALLAAEIALAVSAATVLPAAAATSGSETLSGALAISGVSGTRPVISSVLVAKGVFRGVGRIVEPPDLPTGPAQLQPGRSGPL